MTTTMYHWDPLSDNVLEGSNDSLSTTYTNEPGEFGTLVSHSDGTDSLWYQFDARGDTKEQTNNTHTITGTQSYDASGSILETTGIIDGPFQFVGRLGYAFDASAQANYVRARWNRPEQASWMSQDPIGLLGGPNPYSYAQNSPQIFNDPSGLYPGLTGHGNWVFPAFSVGRTSDIQAESDRRFDQILKSLPETLKVGPFRYQYLRNHVSYLRQVYHFFQFLSKVGTSETNNFVFTCKWGWIDQGHFFNNAGITYITSLAGAYLKPPASLEDVERIAIRSRNFAWLASAINEFGQQAVNSNSAWSIEDLPSDMLGRRMGVAAVNQDFTAIGIALSGVDNPFFSKPANTALGSSAFYSLANHWRNMLIDSGAVIDSEFPVGGKTPRQWLEEHVSKFEISQKPPLAGSVQHALSIYRSMDLWMCLCNNEQPRLKDDKYVG